MRNNLAALTSQSSDATSKFTDSASNMPTAVIYLASSLGATERSLIEQWLADRLVGEVDAGIRVIHYETPRDAPYANSLADALHKLGPIAANTRLTPVRVVWKHSGKTQLVPRFRDLLLRRNPRDPSEAKKRNLVRTRPDRWEIAVAQSADIESLTQRWMARSHLDPATHPEEFAEFIARQCELALEREEYRIRGARYKLPRVYKEDVAGSRRFASGIADLAERVGRSADSVRAEALGYLDELRTAHDPMVLDIAAKAFHKMYAKGYGEVDIDPGQIEMLRRAFRCHPVLLLPSHKTNLDSPVLESVLAQQDLPPPTLFAGINMSYWPMGTLMRRAGRVFLRRSIGDNPVYKFALREWLSYLIEKRFNLEWFPEGTRSRTGKLLPPKLGLLSYAADAYRQGQVEDLLLVPISIIYDQAQEVSGYAREAMGGAKKTENLAWMLQSMRKLGAKQGSVYMRIGEPLSMREALGPPDPDCDGESEEQRLALQKLALAVSWRTNQITPITGIAIVTFALLAAGKRAVSVGDIVPYVRLVVRQARDRSQPLTASGEIDTPEQIVALLGELITTGVVVRHDGLLEPVYSVAEGKHLAAAYYRNSMLHFVLERAIGELAVLAAANTPKGNREAEFWKTSLRLRDAFKFEFFFRERPAFDQILEAEMDRINPNWRNLLEEAEDAADAHGRTYRLGVAHAVLRPFIESYHVVAQTLLRARADRPVDRKVFLQDCLKLGRQKLLEGKLQSPEAISRQLFETGVQLIENLKLAEPGPGIEEERQEFARRTRSMLDLLAISEEQNRLRLDALR